MIVADFSLVPMGTDTSAGKYIRAVYEMLEASGVKFVPGPNSTSIEARTFKDIFDIIQKSNEKLAEMGVKRIITDVHIDQRLDKEISIESKLGASKKR
jgi:uncharacterized protein (TIGR00106 family)